MITAFTFAGGYNLSENIINGIAVLMMICLGLLLYEFVKFARREIKTPQSAKKSLILLPKQKPSGKYKRYLFDEWVIPFQVFALGINLFALGQSVNDIYRGVSIKFLQTPAYLVVSLGIINTFAFYSFLRWFYVAYKKLICADIPTEVSAGRGVFEFFIPVMNLVYPYKRMKEITEKSDPNNFSQDYYRIILLIWTATTFFIYTYSIVFPSSVHSGGVLKTNFFLMYINQIIRFAITLYLVIHINKLQQNNTQITKSLIKPIAHHPMWFNFLNAGFSIVIIHVGFLSFSKNNTSASPLLFWGYISLAVFAWGFLMRFIHKKIHDPTML